MNELPPMTLLDYMVSTKENMMLKAFLPYIDKDFQPFLATYIKYTEFLATMDLFNRNGSIFSEQVNNDFSDIISTLLPYVSKEERETFEMIGNMKNIMNIMNMANEFSNADDDSSEDSSSTGDSYDDSSPDDNTSENNSSGGFDFSSELSTLLSPEQQLMFEQLSSMIK